jgi:hypothetical protein
MSKMEIESVKIKVNLCSVNKMALANDQLNSPIRAMKSSVVLKAVSSK